jgi:hypothetical protein
MQMTKMVRKQIKGINKQVHHLNQDLSKQVRHLNKDISRNISGFGRQSQPRSGGLGLFTGLLLVSVPVVAAVLLLSKTQNREKLGKFVDTVKESQQPMLGQIQTRFSTLLEKFGMAKAETESEQEPVQKSGKNGKNGQKEHQPAGAPLQTMGEV